MKLTAKMVHTKSTKNTEMYTEIPGEHGTIIGSQYLQKGPLGGKTPSEITITVEFKD